MNKNILESCDNYINSFLKQDYVQRYFALKKILENDLTIVALRNSLKEAQKALALSMGDEILHQSCLAKYQAAKENYYNNPFVVNYQYLEEEISLQLNELSSKIKKLEL